MAVRVVNSYTVEFDERSGCSLDRAFPFVIKNAAGKIVQYAKTQEGALRWIQKLEGLKVQP